MHRGRRTASVVGLALAFALVFPVTVSAAPTIYVNKGVGRARLGMRDSYASKLLGGTTRTGRDRSYENRVVYYFYYGRRMANRKYPLEMYSNRSRRVFAFVANSRVYKTTAGISVGSTEDALKNAYGTALRAYPGPVYTRYALGGRTGTDFYVRSGVVKRIMVRVY